MFIKCRKCLIRLSVNNMDFNDIEFIQKQKCSQGGTHEMVGCQ
jgi:hypothetical protein